MQVASTGRLTGKFQATNRDHAKINSSGFPSQYHVRFGYGSLRKYYFGSGIGLLKVSMLKAFILKQTLSNDGAKHEPTPSLGFERAINFSTYTMHVRTH